MHGQTSSLQTYLARGFAHGAFATAVETNTYGERDAGKQLGGVMESLPRQSAELC